MSLLLVPLWPPDLRPSSNVDYVDFPAARIAGPATDHHVLPYNLVPYTLLFCGMWYYCAVTGESKKIVFTSGATEKITSGGATSDFWSPHK
jgi:hypothetical protein